MITNWCFERLCFKPIPFECFSVFYFYQMIIRTTEKCAELFLVPIDTDRNDFQLFWSSCWIKTLTVLKGLPDYYCLLLSDMIRQRFLAIRMLIFRQLKKGLKYTKLLIWPKRDPNIVNILVIEFKQYWCTILVCKT